MRRTKRTEDEVSFQLTPMIDMTFLLLIFFMVTAKLSKEQIKMDIRLPVASSAVIPDDLTNRDIINIDESGQYFVGDAPMSRGELKGYLLERFKKNPPLRLYVRADLEMKGKKLKDLMALAAEAGATQVIMATMKK